MIEVVIFGTGKCSDRVERVLYKDKTQIVAYLDNNLAKQGTSRNDIDILPPDTVGSLLFDYIIISTRRYLEVLGQLRKYEVPEEKIIGYYEDNSSRVNELQQFMDCSKWNQAVLWDRVEAELDYIKKRMNAKIDNLEYEIADKLRGRQYYFPDLYPIDTTIERIIRDKCSLCRFGDGEFELMEGRARPRFQKVDDKLAMRLKEVFDSDRDDILIAIADNYGSLEQYTAQAADAIRSYLTRETRELHYKHLNKDRKYHNAYVTRPYIMFKDKNISKKKFDDMKQIWQNRDIAIIEGEYTRMGVKNDLFSGANSVERILAPSKNAFSVYEDIVNAALQIEKGRLILISLGPAVTVLAYDLAQAGYQALDIGHLDNEYEWYLAGTVERTAIPYKYVNEVRGGEMIEDLENEEYEKQIINRIIL